MTTTAEPRRIDILSQPKPFHHGYREQRRSVYWIDRVPFASGPNGTTQVVASVRVRELANPRKLTSDFRLNRPTAILPIRKSTLQREPTERLWILSEPKSIVATQDRSAYASVPTGFPRQSTIDRINLLSQPRMREDQFSMEESRWGETIPVSFAAKTANPSSYLEELSKPKKYHPEFKAERPVQSEVPEHALTSIAGQHLQKLSRPRARTMILDDYDPYKVSGAAQRAKPTARTELLSAPLPRKQRNRKSV